VTTRTPRCVRPHRTDPAELDLPRTHASDASRTRRCVEQGGGEYLTKEGLYGFKAAGRGGSVCVVLNPGIDASNLRSLKKLDDGKTPLVLINTNLDRLTFLDKIGMGSYLDSFEPIYVMKKAGNGYLYKAFPGDYELHAILGGKSMDKIETSKSRPAFLDAEKKIKAAVSEAFRREAEAAAQRVR
jgi:hypothetical protein